jgi:hypothetical protein
MAGASNVLRLTEHGTKRAGRKDSKGVYLCTVAILIHSFVTKTGNARGSFAPF